MNGTRYLIVNADDYGIGSATSQGILDLAARGRVASAVLLVNSPHAEADVRAWRQARMPMELGWHPCLTLDRPILPDWRVPSLIASDGRFWPLGTFVRRLYLGLIRAGEIAAEFRAQHTRFCELVGHPPSVVNTHHHVQVFPPVGRLLLELLSTQQPLPYLRRIQEPWRVLTRVPGARCKRTFLSVLGRRDARRQKRAGFSGNDWLAGITNPLHVKNTDFLTRWLACLPGDVVELTCHPGYLDPTLIGRDCSAEDGQLMRRVCEMDLLRQDAFVEACRRADLTLASPSEVTRLLEDGSAHAA